MQHIPRPDEITNHWLTTRLREAGHATATVTRSHAEPVGTGQVGRCYRYALEFEADPGPDVPRSLVAKFTSDDPTSRETGQAMKTYLTETTFYRHIAPRVHIRVPQCYFADIDDEGLEHLILMEDLTPGHQGDQIAGCTPEVAREAVLQLVGLQAPTWNDERWLSLLGRAQDGPLGDMKTLYGQTMPGFVERYHHSMDPGHLRFIQRIGEAQQCPMFNLSSDPFSLEHYDYRLDNVIIDEECTPPKVTVVDWQSVRVGKPLNDVAYFIGSALEPEVRREVEDDILRDYHQLLCEQGVSGFSFADCYREYRKGVYAGFAVSVVAPVLVEQTDRGDAMFTTMARRYAQMAIDLGVEEFLS